MKPGIEDEIVLKLANDNGSLLVTQDKDFGELVFRQGLTHWGVILVRLGGLTSDLKSIYVCDAIKQYRFVRKVSEDGIKQYQDWYEGEQLVTETVKRDKLNDIVG